MSLKDRLLADVFADSALSAGDDPYVTSATAIDAIDEIANDDKIARAFARRSDEAMVFLKALNRTDIDDREDILYNLFTEDGVIRELARAGYADDIWALLDQFSENEMVIFFSSDGAIQGLVENGEYAQQIMEIIREAHPDDQRAILAADGSVYALSENAEYAEEMMELVREMPLVDQRTVLSADSAVDGLAYNSDYAEEIMGIVMRLREVDRVSILGSDGAVYQLCKAGYANDVVDTLEALGPTMQKRILAADNSIEGLVLADPENASIIMSIVRELEPKHQKHVFRAGGAAESLADNGYLEEVNRIQGSLGMRLYDPDAPADEHTL